MNRKYDLGDLGAEILGISGTVSMLAACVMPAELPNMGSSLTAETLEALFFALTMQLDRVAADVSEWEGELLRLKRENETNDNAEAMLQEAE